MIAWNSETESGEGLTTMFSPKLEMLRLPSRYQAFAPLCPPLTAIAEPRRWVGSGKLPNWLSKPKLLPGGPPTLLIPGSKKVNCCKSRPAKGTFWMMSVCTVLLKLLASVSSIGNSALTSTFSVVDPTFNLASTRIACAERTSMPVMSSEVNPLAAKCARYAPGIKASAR